MTAETPILDVDLDKIIFKASNGDSICSDDPNEVIEWLKAHGGRVESKTPIQEEVSNERSS